MSSALAVLLLLAHLGAGAGGTRAGENRFLVEARRAFDALEYDKVTPLLERALRAPTTPDEEVEIYERLATIHVMYKRAAKAELAFFLLLRIRPDYRLPPGSSPTIEAAFAAAKKRLAARSASSDRGGPPAADAIDAALVPASPTAAPAVMPPVTEPASPPLYRRWWFWTAIGVAVAASVGGGIGGWYAAHPELPETDFGPLRVPSAP